MTVPPNKQFFRSRDSAHSPIRAGFGRTKYGKLLFAAAALLLLLGGFWHFMGGGAPTGEQEHDVAPVRTAKVQRRDMAVVEHTLGTMVASSMVHVIARVQGTLESASFHEGQFVKKGDLLFQIDPGPFQAALAQARAVLARDTALLKNANRDKQRYENLFKQNAISPQQRDTVATNADVLAATVAVDKAAVETAQLDLGYTHIRSPIDGKTGPLLMHPGDMVAAAGNTAMVTIAQLRPIKLSFNLPQSDFPRIRTRQQLHPLIAVIDQHDSQGRSLSAPVNFTSNEVNNQSGTIELRADFDNTDLSLLPGQVANVTVELDIIPKALVVPHDALNDGPNGAYVYKIVNNHAEPRSVKILFDDSKNAAVQGPIRPGDEVITEGQLRVVPSGAVKIFSSAKTPDNARARTNGGGIGGAMNGPG